MTDKEVTGLHRITKKYLKELCKKHKLYQTPYLNDQLYLHFQGFQAIENLEEYSGLKCLWLESNAISEIQGLDCQSELRCLFLQSNLIKKIENLSFCPELDTLNLASNHITKIENCGIEVLPVLSTLNLSRNQLRTIVALEELTKCKNLCSLDLSYNRIDDILVVKIFASMPELKVLVLQGNPVVSRVPQYRKTLILECKKLTYLDSRPVFPKDRACAEAWKRGGYEEERRENERWVKMDRKKIRDSVNATLRLRQRMGAGDVQLLESSDDEDEHRRTKQLKRIFEIDPPLRDDLEITGVINSENVDRNEGGESNERSSHVENYDCKATSSASEISIESHQSYESMGQDFAALCESIRSDECVEELTEHCQFAESDKSVEIESKQDFTTPSDGNQESLRCENKSTDEPVVAAINSLQDGIQDGGSEYETSESSQLKEDMLEDHIVEFEQQNHLKVKEIKTVYEPQKLEKNEIIAEATVEMESTSIFSDRTTIKDKIQSSRSFSNLSSSSTSEMSSDEESISDEEFDNSENQRSPMKSDDNDDSMEAVLQDSSKLSDALNSDLEVQLDSTFVIDVEPITEPIQSTNFDIITQQSTKNEFEISSDSNFADSELSHIEWTNLCHLQNFDFKGQMDQTVSTNDEFDSSDNPLKTPCKTLFRSRLGGVSSQDLDDEEDSGLLNSYQTASSYSEFESIDQSTEKLDDDSEDLICRNEIQEKLASDQSRNNEDLGSNSPKHEKEMVKKETSNEGENQTLIEMQAKYDNILSRLSEEVEIETNTQILLTETSVASDCSLSEGSINKNQKDGEEIEVSFSIQLERDLTKFKEEMGEGLEKPSAESSEPPTWWEKTLAAARQGTNEITIDPMPKYEDNEKSMILEKNLSEIQVEDNQVEALNLLESILSDSQKAMIKSEEEEHLEVTVVNETESENDDSLANEGAASPTIREVLDSFNEIAESISRNNQQKSQRIQNLLGNPLTKEFSQQSGDQINSQVEEMKLKQRERISMIVDEVYAQREKYDDTLEVFDGRLMVVNRSTGALEELPPSPLIGDMSCGTNSTSTVQDGSDSDDYGTADDEDYNETIEQHASYTKISRRTSPPIEISEDDNCQPEEEFDSKQKISKLHNGIDVEFFSEVNKWMEDGLHITAEEPEKHNKNGKEEALLMKKVFVETNELEVEVSSDIKSFMEIDEAALEDIAIIFESPD